MRKIGRIVLAWWYWITNRNNCLSKERLQHCAHCEFRVWFVCGECGCPLQAKSRIKEEECPRRKWPDYYLMLNEQLKMYWLHKRTQIYVKIMPEVKKSLKI